MNQPHAQTRVMIVGGGTAGHVLPGVAIGRELVARGMAPEEIHFVGSDRGVERTLVPEAGFDVTLLAGRGIARRLTRDNVGAAVGLGKAFIESSKLLADTKPEVVVALGGYASVPAGLWALLRRTPVVVAEQNAVPGLANRLIGRFAKASAVSYDRTDLPRAVWTGNPVRPAILEVAQNYASRRAQARERYGISDGQHHVVVFGGSLGARTINNATIGALEQLGERDGIVVRHIIGRRDYESIVSDVKDRGLDSSSYVPIEYEDDMASVYASADLVVCRAGATSCAELAVTNTPAVLIPLPGAPGDHQTANGRALEAVGGAEVLADSVFDGELMADTVTRLLAKPEILASMREGSARAARPDAAAAVVEVIAQFLQDPLQAPTPVDSSNPVDPGTSNDD